MLSLKNEDLCRNHCFKTDYIKNLPRIIQLIENHDTSIKLKINQEPRSQTPSNPSEEELWSYLILDYARYGQLSKCIEFIRRAINEGDNVGDDEFQDDEELMVKLSLSEVFVLKSITNNTRDTFDDIRAFIVIQPCLTSRTIDTCLASIHVYYNQNWIKSGFRHFPRVIYVADETYMALLHLGIELTKDIRIGYTECVLRICPISNLNRLKALRRYGFEIAVDIPKGVKIKGQLERDYIVVKQFDKLREPRSEEEVVQMINCIYPKEKCDKIFKEIDMKSVAFLPRVYKLKNGVMLLIRSATKNDAPAMYNLILQATKEGRGYGSNEYPTFESFKMWLMIDCYCIIYEYIDYAKIQNISLSLPFSYVSEMVGFSCIGDTWHLRTMSRQAAESNLVINSKFRGQGLGKEILILELGIMKELNYKIMVNDFLTSNAQMRAALSNVLKAEDYVLLGNLKNVSYTHGIGWDGQVIRCCDLQKPHVKLFSEIVDDNNKRHCISSKL